MLSRLIELMSKPYSYDLRQKVIQAIELDGMNKSEAAQVFQISRNTINLWLKRQAETGDYKAKSNRPHCTTDKIIDWGKFAAFAQEHGDKTQAQMATLWDGEISARTISRALHKLGWSRKKRLTATENGTKPDELATSATGRGCQWATSVCG